MEDVLELYFQDYRPREPLVCFDEKLYQLVAEVRQPLPARPGQPQRYDFEYRRAGTCNLFIFFEPKGRWRHVEVTERRTAKDFAQCMKALVDDYYPLARRIRLVLDNLNTHAPKVLYEAFAPAEARRLLRKLEFHYTPKHGSWLNMAEIELSVLQRQCLDRRLGDPKLLRAQIQSWEQLRNEVRATARWSFSTYQARHKLGRLYPT